MQLKHSINSFLAIGIIALVGMFATVLIVRAISSVELTSANTNLRLLGV